MIELTAKGLYCPDGDFYIDPVRKVDRAIVTHAHADHARPGMKSYLCHKGSVGILKYRLGKNIVVQSSDYGVETDINGVRVSLHPAGHIPGSAQVRLESKKGVWVVSGDYKLEDDGLSTVFEAVKCDVFISETTFALPIFQWPNQQEVVQDIIDWWRNNAAIGRTSIILSYALGKAQRLLNLLSNVDLPLLAHRSIIKTNEALHSSFPDLPVIKMLEKENDQDVLRKALVLIPQGLSDRSVYRKLWPYSMAMASGWMALPGNNRSRNCDRSFIMSDHADWPGLLSAVKETSAERVIAMHGYTSSFVKYLNHLGLQASELNELRVKKNS